MKIIETNGITYLEKFDLCSEWYWGTNYTSGDLYEAEEMFLSGKEFSPNRLIFVHYPDGNIFEPIKSEEGQYFGMPAYIEGSIYILRVSFVEKAIRIYKCSDDMCDTVLRVELLLDAVKDCYNLRIDGNPLMLTRQGGDYLFQVIWPEKVEFAIGTGESFLFRKENKMFFSEWHENPEYREEVNVREYPTGKILEKIQGTEMTMPDGQAWILR